MTVRSVVRVVRRDVLLYVVFITGAVVLAVEVMAVRILSPYFGNTIYTFSSVVSVILAALSAGYWRGGRLADRVPDVGVFYKLVGRAGWSVLVLEIASPVVLTIAASFLPLTFGPLVAALVLFFIPSYLFGLLSPFVIRLRADALPERGVGAVSGEVFFWSTLGSIGGSLSSGFLLVPHVGITYSMVGMAVLVIVIGFIGQHLVAGSPLRNAAFMLLVIMLLGGFAITRQGEPPVAQASTVRYTSDGAYELIRVVDQPMANGVTKRVLWLDRSASSGVLLPSGAPAFGYMGYVDLLGIFPGAVSRALVLGAGTGVVAKSLYERYPDATIDIVDVEPKLFDLAHTYFALPDSPRIVTHVADGREFLRTSHTGYQVIFSDMYSTLFSVPWHVMTKEYYRRVYDSLDNGGVYMANIIGSLDVSTPSLFWSTVRTMRQVFDNVSVFAVDDPASNSVQNFILVAAKGTSVLDAVGTRDPASMSSYARLLVHAVNYDPNDLDLYDIFTDDRAPVGLYSVKLAEQRGL